MTGSLRALVLLALLAIAPATGWSLDPSRRISQYAHTAWRLEDGAFSGSPNVVTQTTDGYLWIGTTAGLVRFDGERFVPFAPPGSEHLRNPNVKSLLAARDGSLWIGTGSDLEHWKDGHLATYDLFGTFNSVVEDAEGTAWASREQPGDDRGAVCQVTRNAARCLGKADGLSTQVGAALLRVPDGSFWLVEPTKVHHWRAGTETTLALQAAGLDPNNEGLRALALAPDGSLWAGCVLKGPGLGLQRIVDGQWSSLTVPGLDGSSLAVHALLLDRAGALWVGTLDQGLYRVHDGQADHFGSADGLASDSINGLFEDDQGDLWVATSRGLDRFRDLRVASYGVRQGLSRDEVGSVLAARDGSLWIANAQALDHLTQDKVTSLRLPRDFPGHAFTSLLEDSAGRLWAGVDDGLVIFDRGKATRVATTDPRPIGTVISMAQDESGDVWAAALAGRDYRLLRMRDERVQEELTGKVPPGLEIVADARHGLWLGTSKGDLAHIADGRVEIVPFHRPAHVGVIQELATGPDGSVLAATSAGVIGWRGGTARTMTTGNGLPCNRTHALLRDPRGLWLYTACGLVHVPPEALEAWWRQPDVKLELRVFDAVDGANPSRTNFAPRAARSTDGRLWFANGSVLQMIDPAHLHDSATPPPVHIEVVVADGARSETPSSLRLQPRTRDIEIDYSAPRLAIPQRVRFRYRLDGHDGDWQEPGTRRQAFYTDLPPGSYRFRVIASNEDGIWNNSGASIDFTIPPAFVQTRLFTALCIASAVAVLWALIHLRLQQVKRQARLRAEERLDERERIAREIHDTLLQGTQALSLRLGGTLKRLDPAHPVRPALEDIVRRADASIDEGRQRIQGLRFPRASLHESIGGLIGEFDPAGVPAFELRVEGTARELALRVSDEVLQIAREGVLNALRHAQARRVVVQITYADDAFRLSVNDDGLGMAASVAQFDKPGHWGLRNMRERAESVGGRLDVRSDAKTGTVVELQVPAASAYLHSH